jgi:hypothetical protein
MTGIARSISSKLTAEELAWLRQLVGADLRDYETMQTLVDLAQAFAQVREVSLRVSSSTQSRPDVSCSFCGDASSECGPVYVRDDLAICAVCTAAAVREISNAKSGDA